jgi:O-antigen/teichoic acid export membrane protein
MDFISAPKSSLRARLVSAGAWNLGAQASEMLIQLAANLIMTRLLFPEAFGVMALVMSIVVGLQLVSDLGIHLVIVRDPAGEEEDLLRTAWTIQIIRGLAIWILFILTSIALLFMLKHGYLPEQTALSDPILPWILIVVGLSAVILGFESANIHLNVRKLNFKALALLNIGSRLFSVGAMIIWGILYHSVWALVFGHIAWCMARAVGSHIFVPGPRMGIRWHHEYVPKITRDSGWVMLSSAATFFSTQGDRFLFGIFFPSGILGIYSIAWLLSSSCHRMLARLHGTMVLPLLGETLREQPQRLRQRYYRFRAPMEAVAFLISGVLITAGGKIVEVLYDQRYEAAGWMLQVLAISLLLYPMRMINEGFIAAGQMKKVAAISILDAISLVSLMSLGYYFGGLFGVVVGIALYRLPGNIVLLAFAYKKGWMNPFDELRYIPLFGLGMLVGAGVIGIMRIVGGHYY